MTTNSVFIDPYTCILYVAPSDTVSGEGSDSAEGSGDEPSAAVNIFIGERLAAAAVNTENGNIDSSRFEEVSQVSNEWNGTQEADLTNNSRELKRPEVTEVAEESNESEESEDGGWFDFAWFAN